MGYPGEEALYVSQEAGLNSDQVLFSSDLNRVLEDKIWGFSCRGEGFAGWGGGAGGRVLAPPAPPTKFLN